MMIQLPIQRDYKVLSGIYSRNVVNQLAMFGESLALERILLDIDSREISNTSTLFQLYEESFQALKDNYRNEYVFKNAIATKIVKGKHKLSNCYYSTEYNVGSSVADVAVFNGTSTVYEIKTEFDSFERLEDQLVSYSSVFDLINVVVPKEKVESVMLRVPAHVGVIELSDKFTLSQIKPSVSNVENISHFNIFRCLRKSEYKKILHNRFGYVESGGPKAAKQEAYSLFSGMDIRDVHAYFVEAMRKRKLSTIEKELVMKMPDSLMSVLLSMKLSKGKLIRLYEVLTM